MSTRQARRGVPAAVDLGAVEADDALLDMVGGTGPAPGSFDGGLACVLAVWCGVVRADSERVLVDTGTALAVIARSRRRVAAPAVMARSVLAVALGALGAVSHGAAPGELLWPLHELLYQGGAR